MESSIRLRMHFRFLPHWPYVGATGAHLLALDLSVITDLIVQFSIVDDGWLHRRLRGLHGRTVVDAYSGGPSRGPDPPGIFSPCLHSLVRDVWY